MVRHQKTVTLLLLASLAVVVTAANITPRQKFRNLKVLPQDISEKQLDSIMGTYCNALKVSCDFCHAQPKDLLGITPSTSQPDYALDNAMKENARRMMRMTIDINKNYFYFDSTVRPEYLNVVSCNTCHRGNPYPANE